MTGGFLFAFYFKVVVEQHSIPAGHFDRAAAGREYEWKPRFTRAFYLHFISKCCVCGVDDEHSYWSIRPGRGAVTSPIRGLVGLTRAFYMHILSKC